MRRKGFSLYLRLLVSTRASPSGCTILMYLLTAIGLSPGGSNTHLQTNNTQNDTKQTIRRSTQQLQECGPCPVLASYTLAFALQPRKKHGKTSVRVAVSMLLPKYRQCWHVIHFSRCFYTIISNKMGRYFNIHFVFKNITLPCYNRPILKQGTRIPLREYRICQLNLRPPRILRTLIFKDDFGFIFAPRISRTIVLFIYQ